MSLPPTTAIGVNLLWLVPGAVGGSEEYATRLLGGLGGGAGDDIDLTLFVLPSFRGAHPGLADRFRTEVAPLEGRRRPARVAMESTWLAERSRRRRLRFVHHFGGTVPLLRGAPALVTVHDLQPLLLPHNFGPVKRRWLAAVLPWSVRTSRRDTGLVGAVSRYTADELTRHLGTDPSCVRVIPHGVDPRTAPGPADRSLVRSRYRLGERWFLYPAVTWPHKNHMMLVRAFAAVAAVDPDVLLVLTGAAGPAETEVADEIARRGLDDRVRRTGRVPRADLDALMADAVALAFPSSFEGFGAPVLEAMALGCPVVAASAAALPEAVGDAGILVDPDDPEEWAQVMTSLLHDDERRGRLAAAGLARAAGAGWDAAAAALAGTWREALEWHR